MIRRPPRSTLFLDTTLFRSRGARAIGRNIRSGRDDGIIQREARAGLIAGDVGGCGSNHVGGETGRSERRVQAFGRRWSGDGFELEQVGDRIRGRRKFEIGSVDDLLRERSAASDMNGLGAVMGFLSAGAAGGAGLSAAQILGAGEFV